MRRVRASNTDLEQKVSAALRAARIYYRVQLKSVPGTPDFYIPRLRQAIYVNGCFWHSHDCRLGRRPKSNIYFWNAKLAANAARDARVQGNLDELGIRFVTIWQCEIASLDVKIAQLSEEYQRANVAK